jgi:probable addiction module antidote protein
MVYNKIMFEVRRTDEFDDWLKGLKDSRGRTKIQARIDRLANGNPGDVAPIGEGLSELRVDYRTRDVERIKPTGKKAGQEGVTMAAKSKRRKIKVSPYDSADYLNTEADIKNYLEAVFEEPVDRQMLIHTLGVVARARGMMKLSKDTGITRAGLYKALSPNGNPSFETVTKIVGAFNMRLSAQAA